MADQNCMAASESFASQDEKELRANVQRALEDYIALSLGGRTSPEEKAERE